MFKRVFLTLLVLSIVIAAVSGISFAMEENTLNIAGPLAESKILSVYDPPFINLGNSSTQWLFMYDTLIGNSPDLIPDHPRLAKSWESSEDNLVWTFNLRQDVMFHDGEKFTADDVKATIELQTHPDVTNRYNVWFDPFTTLKGFSEYQKGETDDISGIEIVDDYTVKFIHEEPNGLFLLGMGVTCIMPEHKIKDLDPANLKEEEYFEKPIGTGAFKLSEIKEGEYYRFVANEDYFRGAPKIDKAIIRQIDPSLAIANNDTDFYTTYTLDVINEAKEANYNIEFRSPMRSQLFRFNMTEAPFNDINFRRALIHAIDRDAIIDSFYGGYATKVTTMLSPGYWNNKTLAPYKYNPEKAKELVKKSNYDGRKLDLITYYPDEITKDMLTTIQYYWKQVGIKAEYRYVDGATAGALLYGEKNDEFKGKGIMYAARAYSDPSWLSTFKTDNPNNYLDWSSKQYDEYIDKAIKSIKSEERQKYYFLAQSIKYRDVAGIGLWAPDMANITSKRLEMKSDLLPGLWYPIDLKIHEWELK